ncbi:MAG: T9SS type A sorting domain-containing protein, partial [Ignavibacteriaceae bacterium]|nr:T9SS type A sorting domain-containing protein [Ignavibacteriaceae bacterium]
PTSENFVTTFDYGQTWTSYTTPDSSRLYDIIFTDSLTGFAVGEEGVILKYKYQKPNNVNQISDVVQDFTLFQNYPNPFNPATTIRYNLNEPGYATIKIFNTLGGQIQTLINDYKESGSYEIEWNAINVASGIYFIQLSVNGNVITKKMMLLK